LFSFGDVNNVPIRLVKFHSNPIIIWRIWNECIMVVMDYLMGRMIKHYWLTMNLERRFKIQSGMVIFLNHLRDRCCQRTRCNCWTLYHVCGHPCLNSHWQRQFQFIIVIWSNIRNLVWVPFQKIIIGSSSIHIMIMAMFVITSPH
jgi:hypothetical protein